MAKAKAKSKSSKVAEKVEVLKTPPKPKKQVNPIEEIVSALAEEYNIDLTQATENVRDDLVKLREEVLRLDGMSQSNYGVIIAEIDKYSNSEQFTKIVSGTDPFARAKSQYIYLNGAESQPTAIRR